MVHIAEGVRWQWGVKTLASLQVFLVLALLTGGPLQAERVSDFVIRGLDGRQFHLYEELGKGPIVLEFWATWCGPCTKGLRQLQRIAHDYQGRGVRVFAVSVDAPRNYPRIPLHLKRHRLELPVLLDGANELMKQFHLVGVPATVVLSTTGEVVHSRQGYKLGAEDELRTELERLLEEVHDVEANPRGG